ncbi:hypothetical protein GRJ2_001015600 [Grus japonensis]|uniref:Uncharacterized protein n=1 Tax=Grus japonensis TaxID=30415 RepID=A0ABC9WJ43_GRUJA
MWQQQGEEKTDEVRSDEENQGKMTKGMGSRASVPIRARAEATTLFGLNYETPKSSDNSWTSITASEVGSSSSVSLSPSREDPHSSIMASEASSFAEVSLSPSSDDSWTSIMASDAGCSSQASPSTLLDGENMPHASSVQPSLGHPRADLEEQPGLATQPPCREEVDRCLEVNSMQQNQPDLEIQLGAPTPPPEVPEIHSREMLMPLHHHKGQETLEGLIPETKL